MRRHVQFSLLKKDFNQIKARLAERGETWQTWGEQKAAEVLSEKIDRYGIPLLEMAFDRSSFQNKIAEKLIGALGEFAFIQIAKKNGQKKWVSHKETEVKNLLFQLVIALDLPIKGRFDKKKAAIEMIEFYRNKLSGFVSRSKNAYVVYYKAKPKNSIDESDLLPLLDQAIEMVSAD